MPSLLVKIENLFSEDLGDAGDAATRHTVSQLFCNFWRTLLITPCHQCISTDCRATSPAHSYCLTDRLIASVCFLTRSIGPLSRPFVVHALSWMYACNISSTYCCHSEDRAPTHFVQRESQAAHNKDAICLRINTFRLYNMYVNIKKKKKSSIEYTRMCILC